MTITLQTKGKGRSSLQLCVILPCPESDPPTLIYGSKHRVHHAKIGQQVFLGPPNDALGGTPFELESVDWPRSIMRPIVAWYTFIAVNGEAQEHGQLVLGVEGLA